MTTLHNLARLHGVSPAWRALLKNERYKSHKEAKELEDKSESLFRQVTWGGNIVHDVPCDTSVMQAISGRFYLLESCCSFREEFLPGQSAWKRPVYP